MLPHPKQTPSSQRIASDPEDPTAALPQPKPSARSELNLLKAPSRMPGCLPSPQPITKECRRPKCGETFQLQGFGRALKLQLKALRQRPKTHHNEGTLLALDSEADEELGCCVLLTVWVGAGHRVVYRRCRSVQCFEALTMGFAASGLTV